MLVLTMRNIYNLKKVYPDSEFMTGNFKSRFFRNEKDNELSVHITDSSLIEYTEKCIEHFNSMSDSMIDEICNGIIEEYNELADLGMNNDFVLPELESIQDILNYCRFTDFSAYSEYESLTYLVAGDGYWGQNIGFIVENGKVGYIGSNYFDC